MIGELVARLIAAGTPPDVAASVVAEAFAVGVSASIPQKSADMSADKRREKDRIRKQIARGIPQISADVRGNPQMSETASLSKEERIESKEGRKRETTRGSRLPDGWTPIPQDWAVACELLGEPKACAELAKFRDHWAQQPGARGVKLDWNAAWRNWTRRASEYSTPRNGAQNGRRTVHDAANDLLAKISALDEPAPGSLRSGAGQGVVRLLPPR